MNWNSKYDPPTLNSKYGEWTVIEDYNKSEKFTIKSRSKVKCSCGNIQHVNIYNLITGLSASCGCARKPRSHEKPNNDVSDTISNKIKEKHYTLIHYINYYNDELDSRVMTYALKCPNGHLHERTNTHSNLELFIDSHECWCMEENPLIKERLRNDMTLEEVGHRFGISRQAVQYWESDKYNIPEKRLLKLLKIYNSEKHVENQIRNFKKSKGLRVT